VSVPICVVDAFAAQPFAGNPAAVCVLDAFPGDDWLQSVAAELNLSETAFAVPRPDGDHDLRWFTPGAEVDLCGHATLASAHVLGGTATFHTRSGALACRRTSDGWIEMDFPALPPTPAITGDGPGALDPTAVGKALGTEPAELLTSRYDHLVVVADAPAVRALQPDLAAVHALGARGVIVTAAGDRPGIDCVSRFFAPAVGVPEDPVTGSAHCVLAPFWAERLGRTELVAEQASRRGGLLRLRYRPATADTAATDTTGAAADTTGRVALAGQAVTVWEGRLLSGPPGPSTP
jgi:predicted PhzF superfamily epimerase YddE/YHI9